MQKQEPIGVLDSGVGGLTVLKELRKILPRENFVYVADGRYYPYGEKSVNEVYGRVKKLSRFFVSYPVKAIVLACNTASVFGAEIGAISPVPVVGAVEPVCRVAAQKSKQKRVIVLATTLTVNSDVYQKTLNQYGVEGLCLACPSFVRMAEEGACDQTEMEKILRPLVASKADVVIHGCTHFGLLEREMKRVLPNMKFLSCGKWQARQTLRILQENGILNDGAKRGKIRYYITR